MSFWTEREEWLFEQRRIRLVALARENPYRHPWAQRTWWDWEEIRRRENPPSDEDAAWDRHFVKAMLLAGPSLEVCEALLRGEQVPVARLDQNWAREYGLL